jgi:hypothetical protein
LLNTTKPSTQVDGLPLLLFGKSLGDPLGRWRRALAFDFPNFGIRRKDPRLLQNGEETWDQHTQSSAAAVSGGYGTMARTRTSTRRRSRRSRQQQQPPWLSANEVQIRAPGSDTATGAANAGAILWPSKKTARGYWGRVLNLQVMGESLPF